MVNVNNLISENLIYLDFKAKDKNEVLNELGRLIYENDKLYCPEENETKEDALDGFIKSLIEREETFSTAVGYSFAIPHGKCKYVKQACIAYTRLTQEINWSEDEKIRHVFMIGVSDTNAGDEYLEILIKLSKSILEDEFREKLEMVKTKSEVMDLLEKYSSKERSN